jgi:CheY-like chemotaxis protein
VECDPSTLQQLLMNLLINARDAMPDGGSLIVATSICQVRRSTFPSQQSASGRFVCLRVSDTGCGMDEATRARVFEPFFTTKENGNGLGLATVFGDVSQLGGFLDLDSTPGEGTTFSLYFPAGSAPTASAVAQITGKSEVRKHAGNILVVEDEPAIRTLLDSTLSRAGYTALLAARPTEAIAIWAGCQADIDLILTDMVMPDMNGPALIRRLRADRPDVPVIFMTGYAPDHHDTPADTTVILKPFKSRELLDLIAHCIP